MIVILDAGSSKTKFIQEICEHYYPCKTIGLHDSTENDILNAEGIIISGAPILLSEVDPEPYLQKVKWLDDYKLPVLGICFGHQLTGLHFGASISRQREDRGKQEIAVLRHNPLFEDLDTQFTMQEDHCEAISIPPGFEHNATSDSCVNEGMHHKNRPIFGVQFHPEVSGENGMIFLHNFTKLVALYKDKK